MDVFFQGKGYGTVAQRLLANGMNPAALRPWIEVKNGQEIGYFINRSGKAYPVANATLRKDEWKHYDTTLVETTKDRLVGVADLNARGLVYNVGNGLGTTVLEYEKVSDISPANISMDGATKGDNDRPDYDIGYLPLPIVHADWRLNIRVLNASRTTGVPLDTTIAAMKGRVIAEKLEDLLFNGITGNFPFGGGYIYGFTTHPQRNTYTLVTHWDDSPSDGDSIVADVLGMKQALIDDGFMGPYMLYVPTNYDTVLDNDYTNGTWNTGKTVRQRIRDIEGIIDVKVADRLTADNVVLVQFTSDVVRMVNGLPLQTVEWDSQGGMVTEFKAMTIQVPQIRCDYNSKSGVCHAS